MDQAGKTQRFRELHVPGDPLLLPNPWDVGSAKLFAHVGFEALATTSAGHAHTLGRLDGAVSLTQALDHACDIVDATALPVSSDFENGFADDPSGVAESVRLAAATGLAGLSIEDWSGSAIYEAGLAAERVAAAVEAAPDLVITARCENYVRDNADFADTLARLQSYQEAGATVLYAPFMSSSGEIRTMVESVDLPVNVLARPDTPPLGELADIGVARISVGAGLYLAALSALEDLAREFLTTGSYDYSETGEGVVLRDAAFDG